MDKVRSEAVDREDTTPNGPDDSHHGVHESDEGRGAPREAVSGWARVIRAVGIRNMSAIYVFVALFAIFAIWVPGTFLTTTTFRSLLDEQALTAFAAVALVIPLSAGMFDLAIGAEVGVGAIVVAWLLSSQGFSVPLAIIVAVACGALVGLANGLLVTKVRIDSFIATLGVSSVLAGVVSWISGDQQILGLSPSFSNVAGTQLLGVQLPFYYLIVMGLVVWYILERTPVGRRVYATGGNADAARLSGVRTNRVVVASFVAGGALAALAGVLVSANLATGDPTIGPGYLLPTFSAAFLGSTQFKRGRFNVWGTIIAVYVLATGVKGLELAGAPTWIPDLFNGIALLIAVGLARYERRGGELHPITRLLRGLRRATSSPASP